MLSILWKFDRCQSHDDDTCRYHNAAIEKWSILCETSDLESIWQTIKGALDNFSLILDFFKKVEIFIPLEVYTYVVSACSILLATSTHLQRYIH